MAELNFPIHEILNAYHLPGSFSEAVPFGSGHINDTIRLSFRLDDGSAQHYVLQKLNRFVFRHPEEVMHNMVAVTEFLRNKILAAGGNALRETLTVIHAADGNSFYRDSQGEYWRLVLYITDAVSYDMAPEPALMHETGLAFGNFQRQLSDFPAETLRCTIPDFHNTEKRYTAFCAAVERDTVSRGKSCREEIDFLLHRAGLSVYTREQSLPLRVTHNDTKINNIMFDKGTGKALCVLDLDTVMPGFVLHDFGDAIRTGAATAAEDEKNISLVGFDMDMFTAFARGFSEGLRGCLTKAEVDSLAMGALVITYEQALRFLTDYLQGDPYYKTEYPEHNLIRTRTQIYLLAEMERRRAEMENTVRCCFHV